jgi:hypothetical protein
MASECDSTLSELSIEPSIASSSTKSRKKTSPIHEYTREPYENEPKKKDNYTLYYCKLCTDKPYSGSSTTNIRQHLLSAHEIKVRLRENQTKAEAHERLAQLYAEAIESEIDTEEVESAVLKKVLNKDVLRQALVNLIVVRNLPFNAVHWPELHVLCGVLNPESTKSNLIPTSAETIVTCIKESFMDQKDVVRKKVQSALSSIHLSVDIWTSPNNYLFLSTCAHFTDDQAKPRKALLALRTVSGHSGEDQWEVLLPVLQEYRIVGNVGALVADNSGTNDTLCRKISSFMESRNINWDPSTRRIRCQGHIINLAVQGFLFEGVIDLLVIESYEDDEITGRDLDEDERQKREETFRAMGVLGKLHNIVVYSRGSAGRTLEFKLIVGRMIPMDNRTRWNSWFKLLDAAIEKEAKVDEYVKKNINHLEDDVLSPRDWQNLRTIHSFLKPFHRATLELQGDSAKLDQVFITMDILLTHIEKSLVRLLPLLMNEAN